MSHITRLNQQNAYVIVTPRNTYCVSLTTLHNSPSGAPRYNAVLAVLDNIVDGSYCYNSVYNFTGHYLSALDECRWIVAHHEGVNPVC